MPRPWLASGRCDVDMATSTALGPPLPPTTALAEGVVGPAPSAWHDAVLEDFEPAPWPEEDELVSDALLRFHGRGLGFDDGE